tara:strand:+ start:514 stop:834 length:321 start_codon:yes stop_codon:yes gene_type:complete
MKTKWGEFCNIFGTNPRNRILEFFLEGRELDFALGDVAKETGLNRATAYNKLAELIEEGYLIPTRKISGGQLYKLNKQKKEVMLLISAFNMVLRRIAKEHPKKIPA